MQMKYAQQKQREMGNLLGKTLDTWLSFVTQDYTYSVAKSIGLLFKISKLKLFTSVMDAPHCARHIRVRYRDEQLLITHLSQRI